VSVGTDHHCWCNAQEALREVEAYQATSYPAHASKAELRHYPRAADLNQGSVQTIKVSCTAHIHTLHRLCKHSPCCEHVCCS
jgi:hypothetical protein